MSIIHVILCCVKHTRQIMRQTCDQHSWEELGFYIFQKGQNILIHKTQSWLICFLKSSLYQRTSMWAICIKHVLFHLFSHWCDSQTDTVFTHWLLPRMGTMASFLIPNCNIDKLHPCYIYSLSKNIEVLNLYVTGRVF